MKRIILLPFLLMLLSLPLGAQGVIEFEKNNHDFGDIAEEGGLAEYKFTFKNTGSQPVIIRTVNTSCGCTASNWSREPVKPGEEGFIVATYNPRGRPGRFHKSLTVRSNSEPEVVTLYIRGNVTPRPKTLNEQFSYRIDNLGLSSSYIGVNRLLNTETELVEIEIYNFGAKALFMEFRKVPSYIKAPGKMVKLNKGERKKVQFEINGKKMDSWGYTADKILCRVNGNDFPINLGITREENFSANPAEWQSNPPRLAMDQYSHDFSTIPAGQPVKMQFTVTNRGGHPLLIRGVTPTSADMRIEFDQAPIKPGQSRLLSATLQTDKLHGHQYLDINLITNDPKQRYVRLRVQGSVEYRRFDSPNDPSRPRVPHGKYDQ